MNTAQCSGAQQEVFQSSGGFVELMHFDKRFHQKTQENKVLQAKNFEIFLLATFKTTF